MSIKKLRAVSLAVLLSLTLSLIFPVGVLADDNLPPATETPEVVVTPPVDVDAAAGSDALPTEEPVSTEEAYPTEEPLVTDVPVVTETPIPSEDTVAAESEASLTSQLPEGTDIVVLDENGSAIPLASQDAAAVVLEADPIWCPTTALTPTPNANGCTADFPTMTALLNFLAANENNALYKRAGVIYLEQNPVITAGIFIDAAQFSVFDTYDLKIKGGWNNSNSAPNGTQSVFDNNDNVYLQVGSTAERWGGTVTIQDILIQDNDIGTRPSLAVYTSSGGITLNNVDVDDQADGQYTAYLDSTSGNIFVTNGSTFDGEGDNRGFSATTGGSITITGTNANRITFTDARGPGATSYAGATLNASTVNLDYVTATGSDGNGLSISSTGSVTIDNTRTDNNNTGISITNAASVSIDDTSADDNNTGINIANAASVSIDDTSADDNNTGINIANAASVSIDDTSVDNNNTGINVGSTGNVTISDTDVSDSNLNGINVNITGAGAASLTNVNVNNGENGSGVIVNTTSGNIRLNDVDVSNQADGRTANLTSTSGNIFITNRSSFDGDNNNDNNQGFNAATTSGSITITGAAGNGNQITFTDAQGNGVTNNNGVTLSAPTVNLDYVTATGNDGNGLSISSTGSVTIDNTRTDNNNTGISITNAASVSIDDTSADDNNTGINIANAASVSIDDTRVDDNTTGINVGSTGNVTISDTDASDSNSNGINVNITGAGAASLANVNVSNGQNGSGVIVNTTSGNITLNDVDVSNQADGRTANLTSTSGNIFITNRSSFDGDNNNDNNQGFNAATTTGSITITGTAGNGNQITFTDAQGNGDNTNNNGATLSAPSIALTYASATNNDGNGFFISNANQVTLNNVVASNNGTDIPGGSGTGGYTNDVGSGVRVNGNGTTSVIVAGGTFDGNRRYGIEVSNTLNNTIYVTANPQSCVNDGGCYYPAFTFDNTAPTASVIISAPNVNGWYNTAVVASFIGDDGSGSGIATCSAPITLTEGAAQSVSGTCTDLLGNVSAPASRSGINIDMTVPTIAAHGDETVESTGPSGAVVTYVSPKASDLLSGTASTANCAPASGSTFSLGDTTVTCTAIDAADNKSTSSFTVTVRDTTPLNIEKPANIEEDDDDQSALTPLIPVTGVEVAALSCTKPFVTTLAKAGFEVTFANLCNYSAVLAESPEDSLFNVLPDDNKFIGGIEISLLKDGDPVKALPADASMTLSFELPDGMAGDALVVLFWDANTGSWVEKSVNVSDGKVTLAVDMPGTFVLVDKSITVSMEKPSHVTTTLNGLYLTVMDFFKQFSLQ